MNRACFALLVAVSTSSLVHAQPASDAQADAALSEGRRLYDLQEWDQAIAKFKEAYRLRADAPALFNIAQAYRLKGDCAQAASFYKTFKRNFPKEKNIAKVDKFISEMEECAKNQPAAPTMTVAPPTSTTTTTTPPQEMTPTTATTTAPATTSTDATSTTGSTTPTTGAASITTTEPVDAPSTPGRGLRIAGIATGGVGLIMVGAGVVFGVRARSSAGDAENLRPGEMWDPSIQERGETNEKRARTMLIGGGVALVAGTVMYFLGSRKAEHANQVTIVPTSDGATVGWSGRF